MDDETLERIVGWITLKRSTVYGSSEEFVSADETIQKLYELKREKDNRY